MDMTLGLKHTEAGVLPVDWKVHPLGDLLTSPPSYGINAPAIPFNSRHPTYLRITDISEDGRFQEETKVSVKHALAASYVLTDGDIVFARTGASVGKSYLYDHQDGELVFAGFLIRVRPDLRKLSPKYLKYFTHSSSYWTWVKVNSMRSGQPGINGKEYAALPIPLPPTKAEQETIATALSGADSLIELLGRLVEKKRHLKQGAMRELLTGEKRLSGFQVKPGYHPSAMGPIPNDWGLMQLGEGIQLLSGQHVLARYCNVDGVGMAYITGPADFPEGMIRHTKFTTKPGVTCQRHDILITVKGSGAGALVHADDEYCISRQLMAIRVRDWDAKYPLFLASPGRTGARCSGDWPHSWVKQG